MATSTQNWTGKNCIRSQALVTLYDRGYEKNIVPLGTTGSVMGTMNQSLSTRKPKKIL
jgi:hypothetical protein